MIEGLAFALLPDDVARPVAEEAIKEMYRRELTTLLRNGELRPSGKGTVNVIFLPKRKHRSSPVTL
jgi:hypothetical protein